MIEKQTAVKQMGSVFAADMIPRIYLKTVSPLPQRKAHPFYQPAGI